MSDRLNYPTPMPWTVSVSMTEDRLDEAVRLDERGIPSQIWKDARGATAYASIASHYSENGEFFRAVPWVVAESSGNKPYIGGHNG